MGGYWCGVPLIHAALPPLPNPSSSSPSAQLHNSRRKTPPAKPGQRSRPPSTPLEPSLGVLLIDFFRLYGRVINMKEVRRRSGGRGGDKMRAILSAHAHFFALLTANHQPSFRINLVTTIHFAR